MPLLWVKIQTRQRLHVEIFFRQMNERVNEFQDAATERLSEEATGGGFIFRFHPSENVSKSQFTHVCEYENSEKTKILKGPKASPDASETRRRSRAAFHSKG